MVGVWFRRAEGSVLSTKKNNPTVKNTKKILNKKGVHNEKENIRKNAKRYSKKQKKSV